MKRRRSTRLDAALVLLRVFIGWHFLYEGYYKLALPGWSRAGAPLADWSAAAYLKAATGPAAGLFHWLAGSAPTMAAVDVLVPAGLVLVGVSLVLGLFTQLGCWGALTFLTLFYVSAIPLEGVPRPQTEGAYLFVNKNLIEWAAVLVLTFARTGDVAGLDLLIGSRRRAAPAEARVARRWRAL